MVLNKILYFNENFDYNNDQESSSTMTNRTESNDTSSSDLREARITEIIESIKDTQSFKTALTHKSSLKSNSTIKSYETLEFLGDSILQFYITIFLYNSFINYSEGRLAEDRIMLTQNNYLANLSLKIGLYKYLKYDKKVSFTDTLITKVDYKILGDIFESFIAALFIEKGSKLVCEFLSLTVLNRPEYIDKLPKFDKELSEMYKFNILLWIDSLEASIIPIIERNNLESEFKEKLLMLIDKSLNTQNHINDFIIKNNEIINQIIKGLIK